MWPFRKKQPAGPAPLIVDRTYGDPRARALVDALAAGDWKSTRDIFEEVRDPNERAYLMEAIGPTEGVQDWIGDWIAAEPQSTLPLLFKGCHGVQWAWQARGARRAEYTTPDQFRAFAQRMRIAENALDDVVARDPDDLTAHAFLVTSSRARQVPAEEAARRYDEVAKRHSGHVVAYEQRLQYLCEKWFGSHEQMYAFAREAAAAAPAGSLVPGLVAVAHLEQWVRDQDMARMETDEVRAELLAAAEKSIFHPSFTPHFGWQTRGNLFAMAFRWAELNEEAARVFDMLGDNPCEWPWQYRSGSDPVQIFTWARDEVYDLRATTA